VKYSIFLILLLIFTYRVQAYSCYFDFSLSRYLIDEDKETVVDFKYELEGFNEKLFLVKPFIANGIVEVFNPEKNIWASSFSLVSDLPHLQKEMLIRVKGFGIEKTNLYFEILNLSNGRVYLTPKKEVWSEKVYEKYLDNVNKKIKENSVLKNEGENIPEETLESVVLKDFRENRLYKKLYEKATGDYFYLLVFLEFLIFFYIGFRKNKNGFTRLDFKSRTYGVNGKIP
jgi:hypothetical protein